MNQKPRKPIPRTSAKRAKEQSRYRTVKRRFLSRHWYCEKCKRMDVILQVHHYYGRIGALLCYIPGFMAVCAGCHDWIENHRNEAVKLGLRAPDSLFNRPSKVIPR